MSEQVEVRICQICTEGSDLYATLQKAVQVEGLPARVEKYGCLGGCTLYPRVEVLLPDGKIKQYGKAQGEQFLRDELTVVEAFGADPIQTIIRDNV